MELDRWQWLKALSSNEGPRSPIARLVAHTLALHMKADLSECYPSQPMLARESGLCERAVRTAIKSLVADGWLEVAKVRTDGRVWCKSVYLPRLPALDAASNADVTARNGTTDDRHHMPVVPAPHAATGGTTCLEYRHHMPTNQSLNQISKQISKRIQKQKSDDLHKSREKAEEVSRDEDRRKIRSAVAELGHDPQDIDGIAKLLWLKPDRVRSLIAECMREVSLGPSLA